MAGWELFGKLGLFVVPNAIPIKLRAQIASELALGERHQPARVIGEDEVRRVDDQVRRTRLVEVSNHTQEETSALLEGLRSTVEAHFRIPLGEAEPPQFLAYLPGDFFQPHWDRIPGNAVTGDRRISIVLFVNGAGEAGEYQGGDLVFFGLLEKPGWESVGFPLQPSAGLLVAFPSDLWHEVSAVTAGIRHTVVSWYQQPPDRSS